MKEESLWHLREGPQPGHNQPVTSNHLAISAQGKRSESTLMEILRSSPGVFEPFKGKVRCD